MKRLIVFQNYSYFNRAEEYILYLLKSFREIADKIIVLSNSELEFEEKRKYQNVSDEYYERENIGYDAGAYKDFFQNHTVETLSQWDEIVLANSTFFGPLYSWEKVFSKMSEVKCDFWGLSRHAAGGKLPGTDIDIPPHIQSYFIVIRKPILTDNRFYEFWHTMEYPKNWNDAIVKFEFSFTHYFSELGYRYSTCLEQYEKGKKLIDAGGDASYAKPFELISECEFPIIKYKSVMGIYQYKQAVDVLKYIKQNTKYNPDMIQDYINVLDRADRLPLSGGKILDFVKKYSDIYIFGHGLCAQKVEFFLNEQGYKVRNFIVTVPANENEISLKDIDDYNDKGVIVALGMQAFSEVKDTVLNMVEPEHLLLPNH